MMTLEGKCEQAVGELRAALIELYDAVGADPTAPQEVSRQFRIGKTLAWNVARLMQASDAMAAVPHVPGIASIESVVGALASSGAPEGVVGRVREAAREFERMIEEQVGDRATLDLVIDGMSSNGESGLRWSRKQACQGNSGIYGVQAKTHVVACFVAPNARDPGLLDMAMVRGFVGVRRLRTATRHTIARTRHWSDEGQALGSTRWGPIDPARPDLVIPEFTRGALPHIVPTESDGGTDYVIQPGLIGNLGAFDFFMGDSLRAAASRYATERDRTGLFGATIAVPTELLVFDLIVHEDVAFALRDTPTVYAHPPGSRVREGAWDEAMRLPITMTPEALSGAPPAVATPAVPRYREVQAYVAAHMGWEASAFRGSRLRLDHPPLGSTVVRRFELPSRG